MAASTETTSTPSETRTGETNFSRGLKLITIPLLHLACCIAISFTIAYVLDGYHAVPTESGRYVDGGQFKLNVSDVTTLISTALTIVRLLVGAWVGTILWNCAFILLEKRTRGITLPQLSRMMTWSIPPSPRSSTDKFVLLLLFLVIPQQFIAPLITGAVNWNPSFEFSQTLQSIQAGSPEASSDYWYLWAKLPESRKMGVRRAAAMSTMAWGGSGFDRAHPRHVTNNGVSVAINSTLYNAVVPCIQIHSITFPTSPPPDKVFEIIQDSHLAAEDSETDLSRVEDPPLRYIVNGNAVLFDPDDMPEFSEGLPPMDDDRYTMELPADYQKSGIMYAVVLVGVPGSDGNVPVACDEYKNSIFGKTLKNAFNISDGLLCFTYALVNVTAGVALSQTSKYIADRVVEADLPSAELDLKGGPWVKEAMYLMSDVMSSAVMMNTTTLTTWDDIEGYLDKLIRYSYQGAWDMLYRSYEPDTRTLDVRNYESRIVASVSKARVFAWLALSMLLTLSAIVLAIGKKALCERSIVFDGPVAALVTDAADVLVKGGKGLTNLAHVRKEKEVGEVQLIGSLGKGFCLKPSTQA